jgi:hypothetical protein
VRFMTGSTEASKGSTDSGAGSGPRPIYSRCGSRDIVSKRRTMLARQRCGGGHAGRRFLGYSSSKAPLVRRCITLGQTAGSGLRHYQPARGGDRGCRESRDLRQRQLSAAAVWPPRSRLTAIGQHGGSPAGFLESGKGQGGKLLTPTGPSRRRRSCPWLRRVRPPRYGAPPS